MADSKKQVIDKFKTHDGDTGSPEVQVALLSQRIDNVKDHLKSHDHDNHSRRGLLSMINKRRRLLHYLMRKVPERYKDIIGKLNLAK
ncbi:30S ribosomal protein S15 [Candidatus Curtissbacteria bacterium]|nr:30S ribosomal protein S15 [Candidatus Curtissbacteria bacterium]